MPLTSADLGKFLKGNKPQTIRPPVRELPAIAGEQRLPPPVTPPPVWRHGFLPPPQNPQTPLLGQQRAAAMRDLGHQLSQVEHFLRTAADQLSAVRARVHALDIPEAAPAVPPPQSNFFGDKSGQEIMAEINALRTTPRSRFFNKSAQQIIAELNQMRAGTWQPS